MSQRLVVVSAFIGLLAALLFTLESDKPEAAYNKVIEIAREATGNVRSLQPLTLFATPDMHVQAPCPAPSDTIVIVTGGQSNAGNAMSSRHVVAEGTAAFMWYDGACYLNADPVLGTGGSRGSLWSLLGEQLALETAKPVLFVHGAIGGSVYQDWLRPQSRFYAALAGRMSGVQAAGYNIDLILWHQGESDARDLRTDRHINRVEAALRTLTDRLLAEAPKAQIYMFQASLCNSNLPTEGTAAMREIQNRVAAANDRIYPGMNTDQLGEDYRWDWCHFNSLGRKAIVETILPDVLGLLDG